jgi:hypothetical protein
LSFVSLIFRSYTPLPRHRGILPGFLYGYKIWFFTLRKGIDSVCFGCYGEYMNLRQNGNKDYGYICRTKSHNNCNLHRIFSEIKSKKKNRPTELTGLVCIGDITNAWIFCTENLKERDHLGNTGLDARSASRKDSVPVSWGHANEPSNSTKWERFS